MAGRQTKEDRNTRESAMVAIFKADPKLSAAKANAQFKAKFGSMMRTNRVYELKARALRVDPPAGKVVPEETAAQNAKTILDAFQLRPIPTPDDPSLLINILKPDDNPTVNVLTPKVFCGVKGCSGHEDATCSCPKPEGIPEVDLDPKDWSF